MQRIDGFINLNEILGISDDIKDFKSLMKLLKKNKDVKIVKYLDYEDAKQLVISFTYLGEVYYYKFDYLKNRGSEMLCPYNELIAHFIAEDMKLDSVFYDLALLGKFKGVISKDFKEKGVNYISFEELLKKVYHEDYNECNNLESIWNALDMYYYNDFRSKDIKKIMEDLVKLYIFDMFIGNEDRHNDNFGIAESANEIKLQPIYDNSRMLMYSPEFINVTFTVDNSTVSLMRENMKKFLDISSAEFRLILPEFLWVISEENILKIIGIIEKYTKQSMPKDIKEDYLEFFSCYYDFFQEIIEDNHLNMNI